MNDLADQEGVDTRRARRRATSAGVSMPLSATTIASGGNERAQPLGGRRAW